MNDQSFTPHLLGAPRIGANRELKKAVENYWAKKITANELESIGKNIRQTNWQAARNAGIQIGTVGDFSFYDHILDFSHLIGAIPKRHEQLNADKLTTMFAMARGDATNNVSASPMTKWYNTNYHYIIPELDNIESFMVTNEPLKMLLASIEEAKEFFKEIKVVLPGPVSYLRMAKFYDGENSLTNKKKLLPSLLLCYKEIFEKLGGAGAAYVQLDEGILSGDFSEEESTLLRECYSALNENRNNLKIMVASYFGCTKQTFSALQNLPVQAVHLDFCEKNMSEEEFISLTKSLPQNIVSLGIISGRNIWRASMLELLEKSAPLAKALQNKNLMLSCSCSLLHCPVSLKNEHKLDEEIKSWLAFGEEKMAELVLLKNLLLANHTGKPNNDAAMLAAASGKAAIERKTSKRIHLQDVKARLASVREEDFRRNSEVKSRLKKQKEKHPLPLFPTTTIGSFPQTTEVRKMRASFRNGKISQETYDDFLEEEIANAISIQKEIGIDLLVHGEAERNDMVEYFADKLNGFAFTANGWVQSYGSRCVKPPIIFGDVSRKKQMTIRFTTYAQRIANAPVKGMLTGPLTMLGWSFVRDDQSEETTARQIALALRDEVQDLENAGIAYIQVDEPAIREGMPLQKSHWDAYLKWAVDCFLLTTAGVKDETQIHTHMCYSNFQDIIKHIARMDADVISIESSKSKMELLKAFKSFNYPAEIGPGVYDVHSKRVPETTEMEALLEKALEVLNPESLWVNPDCGLKTRAWAETKASLENMVQAAKFLREKASEK